MTNVITIPAAKWQSLLHLRGRMKYYKTKPNIHNKFKELYNGELSILKVA